MSTFQTWFTHSKHPRVVRNALAEFTCPPHDVSIVVNIINAALSAAYTAGYRAGGKAWERDFQERSGQ